MPGAREQAVGSTITLLDEEGARVRRTVLPGGLRVVTERLPGVRSAAFGIWVGVGSRDETPAQAGAAHYLEHLLFKGTPRRSALDISASIDAVGGEMNAFTSKEYTCFYARVLDADLPLAVDVISDLVTSALLRAGDVESERDVILEEIAMRDDDPGDLVHEEFADAMFGPTPLGRPILGTVDTIEAITPRAIKAFYTKRYRPENMVVAAAGNVDHAAVVRLVKKAFGAAGMLDGDAAPAAPRSGAFRTVGAGAVRVLTKTTEQANVVIGVPGVARDDERRFVLGVLNASLGGGMSSRLFQEVREKRGLAYSVFSFASHFADTGQFGVYAGCMPKKVDEVLAITRDELAKVAAHGLTDEELARGKGQVRGGLVLGLEDTGSRMSRIGKAELLNGRLWSTGEVLHAIDSVTVDDVRDIAASLLDVTPTLAVIGPFEPDRDFSSAVS
ncbi:MAG TPA: pitrilysin family protein [Candidatus Nanopelagicales bacterium]|nr:pitrilysin family protein [Candidatus Nanopelagicales bacterium]